MKITSICAIIGATLFLSACGDEEGILPGERFDIRGNPLVQEEVKTVGLRLPAARANESWTHRAGNAAHNLGHVSLRNAPVRIWSASIGQSSTNRIFQAAEPVIGGGRIFTLDATGSVSAFSLDGGLLWRKAISPIATSKSKGKISGGGLALNNNLLAVTTGTGIAALFDAATGNERWQQKLSAGSTTAPSLSSTQMVVVDGANRAVGLSLKTGRIQWQQRSVGASTSVLGTGSPAISGGLAIVPFDSGEVQGISTSNGLQVWSQLISGSRAGVAKNTFAALTGDPVVVGNRVYVATFAGRMAALDRRSGLRIWTSKEGAVGPMVVAGNSIFVVSDDRKIKRLSSADGSLIWESTLPLFKKVRRQRGNIGHFGPVLAGGQLWVAGSDRMLRAFNPTSGAQTQSIELPSGAASLPVVAGGRLYLILENGQLAAFQ